LPTHPSKTIPEPWLSFLQELDSAVHEEVRMDCMGGFVVTMMYGFSRPTGDLDALEIIPKAAGLSLLELGRQGGPLHKKYKIYLDRVGVAKVPEDYESRLTEIFPEDVQASSAVRPGPVRPCAVKAGTPAVCSSPPTRQHEAGCGRLSPARRCVLLGSARRAM
jgi:hypothetical protein